MNITLRLSKLAATYPKQILQLKWAFWFMAANSVMSWVAASKLLIFLFPLELTSAVTLVGKLSIIIFIIISYLAHLTLLTMLYFTITLIPLMLLIRNRVLISIIAVLLSSVYLYFLLVDSIVFSLFRFHLNLIIMKMVFSHEVFGIFNLSPLELIIIYASIVGLLIIEYLALNLSRRWAVLRQEWLLEKKMVYIFVALLLFSYYIYIASVVAGTNFYSQQVKVLPYYNQFIAALLPYHNSFEQIERFAVNRIVQLKSTRGTLHYPLSPITCQPTKKPLNIVIIAIDAWRFDSVTPSIMPHLMAYLKNSLNFSQHFSGGNATQPGIFSLFYSLPSNYWDAMIAAHQGPVFMSELIKQHYQLGIFASAELVLPAFNKNVFVDVAPLKLVADGTLPADRDRNITQQFQQFLQQRSLQQPFFSFLFYDAAHGYCQQQNFSQPFQPAIVNCLRLANNEANRIKLLNRYKNAVHFVDEQVALTLQALAAAKLLDNTVVIITADHGQEFNDNQRGYWEHASNYTKYQLQVPLFILWPKQTAAKISYQTTHYDIIPTLMRQVLGCRTPISDYSIGRDLFNATWQPFILAGSYINFAIVTQQTITTIYPSGTIEVQDATAKPINTLPNQALIIQALNLIRKFYRGL